jgi:glutathione S-transferase
MKLYSHPLSLFAAKVRIALAEKALDYTLENVPLDPGRGYQPKHPQVVAHNPKQQVPVFVQGDFVLYDSTVILEYLEDLAPEPALYPRDPQARARCRLLELEADELFFAPIGVLVRRRYARAAGAAEDPSERASVEAAFAGHCARLSQQLADSEFLCDRFSVADISHFLVVCFGFGFGLTLPEPLTNLQAWFARVAARPSVARELGIMAEAARALDAPQTSSEPGVHP